MMLRYIVTKMAHARNPYPHGSAPWVNWNDGFIGVTMPQWPNRWESAFMALMFGAPVVVGATIGLLLGWAITR